MDNYSIILRYNVKMVFKTLYLKIFTITTNALVNNFIYMATSFDPKHGVIIGPMTQA